jgi:hypothetical protein
MIKLILILQFLLLEAFAGDQVSVLVSVAGKSGPLFNREETSQRLIEQFRKHYKQDLRLNIIPAATQAELHRELTNPQNEAVFWISHANSSTEDAGLQSSSVILDVEGNNVKDLFQKVHPDIKFLGVLGCRTAPILDAFRAKGYYSDNNETVFYAREKKINGMKEIRRAIEALGKIAPQTSATCPQKEGHKITISRIIGSKNAKSLKVMNRDKFLGLFPKGETGDRQTLTVYLPTPSSVHDLKLLIDAVPRDEISIVSDIFDGEWRVFADQNGRAIGVNQHIYRFHGSASPRKDSEIFLPFECQ